VDLDRKRTPNSDRNELEPVVKQITVFVIGKEKREIAAGEMARGAPFEGRDLLRNVLWVIGEEGEDFE